MGRGATLPREASRAERAEGGLRLRGWEEGCDEESGASAGKVYDDSAGKSRGRVRVLCFGVRVLSLALGLALGVNVLLCVVDVEPCALARCQKITRAIGPIARERE